MNQYGNLFVLGLSLVIGGIIGKSINPEVDVMIWNGVGVIGVIIAVIGVIIAVIGVVGIFIVEEKTAQHNLRGGSR